MTGPIKPPGATPPRTDVVSPKAAETGDVRFRESLEAQKSEAARGPEQVRDPIIDALRAGKIDAPGAVDALVARALDSDVAKALTPSGRAALEKHLRTQLAEDPAFERLVRDLG